MDLETKELIVKAKLPKMMRAIRKASGLSQDELSKLCGISRQSINYYEGGNAVPTVTNLEKWLKAITKQIKKNKAKKTG